MKLVIDHLNTIVSGSGVFEKVLCLCEKIEREGKIYPAQYASDGNYVQVNLDEFGSISYWRKNGNVSFSKQENTTGIGVQYEATIPLKLVGFVRKDQATNDAYLSDNLCLKLISLLTVSSSALKPILKAKRAQVTATGYQTDGKEVAREEYENIEFEARYTHAYFSIDFELIFTTNSQCYNDLCS